MSSFDEPEYHEVAELLPYMPRARRKLLVVAEKIGKFAQFAKQLPEIPLGLSSLLAIVVPIGTNYEPIEPAPELSTDEFEKLYMLIRGSHKEFLELCLGSGFLRGSKRAQVTRALVMWSQVRGEMEADRDRQAREEEAQDGPEQDQGRVPGDLRGGHRVPTLANAARVGEGFRREVSRDGSGGQIHEKDGEAEDADGRCGRQQERGRVVPPIIVHVISLLDGRNTNFRRF